MNWRTVFTDPDDPQWRLMTNGERYSLNHACGISVKPGSVFYYGRCCVSCGNDMPEVLWGFYKLCAWDK